MQLPIYIYFLIFSALAGITVYFQRPIPLYLKLFPFFLLITIIVEIVGSWMNYHRGTSMALYNIYLVFNISFFLFVLREIILERFFKKVALVAILSYDVFALTNIIYIEKLHAWNSMSYTLGCLLIVAFCIYYFFELFKKPKSTRLTREPAFWIVSGLLFFYCCSFPFLGLNKLLNNAPLVLMKNLTTILALLNILLYMLFTIAFLCRLSLRKPAV